MLSEWTTFDAAESLVNDETIRLFLSEILLDDNPQTIMDGLRVVTRASLRLGRLKSDEAANAVIDELIGPEGVRYGVLVQVMSLLGMRLAAEVPPDYEDVAA